MKKFIFQRFNVERQIEQTFMRRVKLPSGGEIVMEETEALVSIDINTEVTRKPKGWQKLFCRQI